MVGCGEAVLGKIALDLAFEDMFRSLQCLHVLVIDGVNRVASCGKSNGKVIFNLLEIRVATLIQPGHVGSRGPIDSHTIQQCDEIIVTLTVNLAQLYGNQVNQFKGSRIEKEKVLVISPEDVTRVMSHDRLQLEDITHEQQLFAAEGLTHVA